MLDLVDRMRADLRAAMRSRDRQAVRVLRATLAALGNAEAQPATDGPTHLTISGGIAGAADGLGAAEVGRRELTVADVRRIVTAERDERLAAADDLDRHGTSDRAAALRAEAGLLDAYI
jgi:uncharacterized protein YqeY